MQIQVLAFMIKQNKLKQSLKMTNTPTTAQSGGKKGRYGVYQLHWDQYRNGSNLFVLELKMSLAYLHCQVIIAIQFHFKQMKTEGEVCDTNYIGMYLSNIAKQYKFKGT